MLWFFDREDESLRLETRYDNDRSEFVAVVRYPDGRERSERFSTLGDFRRVDRRVRSAPSAAELSGPRGTCRFILLLAKQASRVT